MNKDYEIFRTICDELWQLDWQRVKILAEEADITPQTIHNWRTGYVAAPYISTLLRVANALGYEIVITKNRRRLKRVA